MTHFTDYQEAGQVGVIGDTTLVPFCADEVYTIVAHSVDNRCGRRVIARNAEKTNRTELHADGKHGGGYIGTYLTARHILGTDEERRMLKLNEWAVAADEESHDAEWIARQATLAQNLRGY